MLTTTTPFVWLSIPSVVTSSSASRRMCDHQRQIVPPLLTTTSCMELDERHTKCSAVDRSLELRLFIVHKMQKLRNHTSLGNYSTRLRFSYDIVHSSRLPCTSRYYCLRRDAPQRKNGTKSAVHYMSFIILDPDSGQAERL